MRIRPALALVALVLLAAPPAAPENVRSGTIRWRGTIATEDVLEIRGRRVLRRGEEDRGDRVAVSGALPAADAVVYARPLRGRVLVSIDEQPDDDNDYTASVVVRNDRRGPQEVELEILWIAGRGRLEDTPERGEPDRDGRDFDLGDRGRGRERGRERETVPVPRRPDPIERGEREDRDAARAPEGVDQLRWKGVVDGSDEIVLRGREVTVRHLSHLPVQSMDYQVTGPLPQQPAEVHLLKLRGRGEVRLIEGPRRENGWSAVVLVDDREDAGADGYEFVMRWPRPPDVRVAESGRPLETLVWSGWIDGTDGLVVRGGEVTIEHHSGRAVRGERATFSSPLPQREVTVNLRQLEGRGRAVIQEQPSARNNWTLRVLVEDPSGGDAFYRLELSW